MAGRLSSCPRILALLRRAPAWSLLVLMAAAAAAHAAPAPSNGLEPADAASVADAATGGALTADATLEGGYDFHPRSYGPPGHTPGVPTDEELEAAGAVIGKVVIDNQNIFDLDNPKDNTKLFRLADRLHPVTRPGVIRRQLLFKPGDRFSHRLIEESERILRGDNYFYDAWIRAIDYKDGKVDLRVTTRDVWTLNPGFNFGRSGGQNSVGVQLEEINLLGTGTDVKVSHSSDVDRTSNQVEVRSNHAFGSWVADDANYANLSDWLSARAHRAAAVLLAGNALGARRLPDRGRADRLAVGPQPGHRPVPGRAQRRVDLRRLVDGAAQRLGAARHNGRDLRRAPLRAGQHLDRRAGGARGPRASPIRGCSTT